MVRTRFAAVIVAATFGATLGGCASTPPPTTRLLSTNDAIRDAHAAFATDEPTAAAHLRMAEEQLARGESLMRKGDNASAGWMLARSEADAKLALGIALEAQHRRRADQAAKQAASSPTEAGAPGPVLGPPTPTECR